MSKTIRRIKDGAPISDKKWWANLKRARKEWRRMDKARRNANA